MKVIFKIAQNSEHSKPNGPSINVPRSLTTSEDQSLSENMGYKDILRPIEDVRSFHSGLDQITKGRYDRLAIVFLHNILMKAQVSMLLFDSYLMQKALIKRKLKQWKDLECHLSIFPLSLTSNGIPLKAKYEQSLCFRDHNNVVKQEASTMTGSSNSSSLLSFSVFPVILSILLSSTAMILQLQQL